MCLVVRKLQNIFIALLLERIHLHRLNFTIFGRRGSFGRLNAKTLSVAGLKALARVVGSKVVAIVFLFNDTVLSHRLRRAFLAVIRVDFISDTFFFD